ncbi:MAG: hypothetical protein P0Y55_18020 [Candidatus Cohnella colombiensis]|uniref:Uncharacterized protein n=1 Tax=Candidatus Cohnella colombiensis TaxID=3121368 RepID=A0AA95EWU2_9BACL|nr:MAG: hypothetical protein P0Y55_18020 [Cohnella sp.]
MEHIFDFIQLALSIGLISSILVLPFTYFSTRTIHWNQEDASAGSTLFVSVRQPQLDGIQRWIVRIARRKEAPDEDAHGLSPH